MDEAEKYKQRIEAIAEKRRLQEEQDKARREKEDEKLRLQQLKRKSLRDQWLMEGPPLSPTSLDAQSLRSPLWATQAQDMEKRFEKSQSENKQLADKQEEEDKQREAGQTEALKVPQAEEEMVSDVAQNGDNNAPESEDALLDKSEVILTNGGEDSDCSASEQNNESLANGPNTVSEGVVRMKVETDLGVSEEGPTQVSNVSIKEEEEDEEEEGTRIMRAECVFITDDGDDVPVELTSCADQQESMQSDKILLQNSEEVKEGGEAVDEEERAETSTELEKSEDFGDIDGSEKANEDGETKPEDQGKKLEDPACVQPQSPANALECTVVTLVPVYTEAQPSILSPELGVEGEDSAAATASEGAELASKPQDHTCLSDQFQEVPLADPQENQRTEAGPGEQEPLLLNIKAPNTMAEPAEANSPANTEAQSPTGASQREETESPKHKTCQCCSVM